MSLKADCKYNGKIGSGSSIVASQTGTLSFQVMIEYEDGDTYFPIWLTEKNREKALKYFEIIGADKDKLKNQSYIEFELPSVIVGNEISFGTREEEYNGKTTVKVSWIGKKTDPNLSKTAASFFGGSAKESTRQVTEADPITEEDIPF